MPRRHYVSASRLPVEESRFDALDATRLCPLCGLRGKDVDYAECVSALREELARAAIPIPRPKKKSAHREKLLA